MCKGPLVQAAAACATIIQCEFKVGHVAIASCELQLVSFCDTTSHLKCLSTFSHISSYAASSARL